MYRVGITKTITGRHITLYRIDVKAKAVVTLSS